MPRPVSLAALCVFLAVSALDAAPTDAVLIASAKTSLYLNRLTLDPLPLRRSGTHFESSYVVRVFPVFFLGETGRISIELPEPELARLQQGATISFTGQAENSDHEKRRVTGTATAQDAASGRINVKIIVSSSLTLDFATTYRFTGK